MLEQQGYIRVTDAARLLGVCTNTVRSWGADGKIPEYRHPINNYRLYKRAELVNLLAQIDGSSTSSAEQVSTAKKPR